MQIVGYSLSLDPDFRANHPFIYMIRDVDSNSVIFTGRFQNLKGN